jgi:hypothetical protein
MMSNSNHCGAERSSGLRAWVRGLALAFTVAAVGACGSGNHAPRKSNSSDPGTDGGAGGSPSQLSCATPNDGCACDTEGEIVDCGQVERRSASYVACSLGKRKCTGGTWGVCVGDGVSKNIQTWTPSGRWLGLGSLTACVNNPCDPFCMNYIDDAKGLDGGSKLTAREGGLTLVEGTLQPGQSTCTGLAVAPTPQTITVTSVSPLVTVPPALQFTTQLLPVACARSNVPATWTDSNSDNTAIDSTGLFQVYGAVASSVQLTAYVGTWQASAVANVVVNALDVSNAPLGAPALFLVPGVVPDSVTFLYPYANTVFPRGIAAPVIQWDNGGTNADSVEISLRYPATGVPTFQWSEIIPESSPPKATIAQAAWAGLDYTAAGQDALLVIQRVVLGVARAETTRKIHFSTTPLRGQIYYTEYARAASSPAPSPPIGGSVASGTCSNANVGALIRSLDPGSNTPPVNPFNSVAPGGCPVCHSVSAQGTKFITSNRGWGPGGGVSVINPDSTFTLISDAPGPPNPGQDSRGFAWGGVTPDGKYVLQGDNIWGNTKQDGFTTGAGYRLSGGNGQGLQGDYFNNQNLTGTPVLSQIDQTINFNYGTGSPDPSVFSDHFSVRWTGQVQPYATETYTFETESDEGVRLWVNGVQLINSWADQTDAKLSGTIALVKGHKYDIKLEYYDDTGPALAILRWSGASTPYSVIPETQLYPPPQPPTTNGLTGYYFSNLFLTAPPTLTRVDKTVNFDWGSGAPDSTMPSTNFTIRWLGTVQPVFSETYTFAFSTDDGARLWVNNVQLINNWVLQGSPGACPTSAQYSGSITLTAGVKYAIKAEYYQATGGDSAKLYWSSPSTPCAIVPNNRLFQ